MTVPKQLILALDIGSSGVRAAFFDHGGNLLPRTLVTIDRTLTATASGGSEIDAEIAFRQVAKAVDAVLARAPKGEITHAASSCFWHSLVGVDEKGRPTTPVFGWADTRSRDAAAVLRKKLDQSEVHNRTGAQFHSSFWPAKLLWLKGGNTSRSECARFEKANYWLSLSDLILLRLTGVLSTSVSMASGTGIFDQRKCEWDDQLVKFLKIKKTNLPVIVADGATFKLSSKFVKRWPRLAETQWFPAIGDGAANNFGVGCLTKSRAALMIGTSGAMRIAYKGEPTEEIPPGLWCYRIDSERVIIGGALSDGGGLYDLLKRNLRIDMSDEAIGNEMARRGADAHGLTVMPFFFGERSTGYHENARGAILGLNASHDGIDVLQATMEAVAFRFAEIFDGLKKTAKIDEIVLSGGALNASPVWKQIIADVLGRDLTVLNVPEASLRGACLLALESLGKIDAIDTSSEEIKKLAFHPECHSIYKRARKRHRSVYNRLFNEQK